MFFKKILTQKRKTYFLAPKWVVDLHTRSTYLYTGKYGTFFLNYFKHVSFVFVTAQTSNGFLPRPVFIVAGLKAFQTIVSQMLVAIKREILAKQINTM